MKDSRKKTWMRGTMLVAVLACVLLGIGCSTEPEKATKSVCVAGYQDNGTIEQTCYWVNGKTTPTIVGDGSIDSKVTAIVVR